MAYMQAYYRKNKELFLEKLKEKMAKAKQYVFDYLNNNCCVDCGNNDKRVLEFDHIRGIKISDVNRLINEGATNERLQEEIDKCDVVCGNCHRIRSDMRMGGTYKSKSIREQMFEKNDKSPSKQTKLKKQFRVLTHLKNGCVDCGCKNPIVLEFDHVKDKSANVSRLLSNNVKWETIETEIKKCEVVCRNCHTIRSRTRENNSYRLG